VEKNKNPQNPYNPQKRFFFGRTVSLFLKYGTTNTSIKENLK